MFHRCWLCCLLVGLVCCNLAWADEEKDSAKKTHSVAAQPLAVRVQLEGIVEASAATPVAIAPQVWSDLRVTKVVDAGTRVKKGDALLWLDTRSLDEELADLKFALQQSEVALQQAAIDLEGLQKSTPLDLEQAQRTRDIAAEDLANFEKTDRDFAIRGAEVDLKSTEQYVEYYAEELKQLEKMYAEDELTEETEEIVLKRARQELEFATFYLEVAKQNHERTLKTSIPRLEKQMKFAASDSELDLVKARQAAPLALAKAQLEIEKLKFDQQKAERDFAKHQSDREALVIHSPSDGIVYYGACSRGKWASDGMEAKLRPGGTIAAHEVLMTIVSPQGLRVRADVPQADLQYIRPGLTGKVVVAGRPDLKLEGKVESISPIPVEEGKFDAVIAVSGNSEPLVAGMKCEVKFVPYKNEKAIVVPTKAIFSDEIDEDQKYVYVHASSEKTEKRIVGVGKESGDNTEVVSGLKVGEEILLEKP
jgi:multidrug resistance efflux pump